MRILIIGGDRRMDFAAEKLSETYETARFSSSEDEAPEGRFDVILLPMPLSKNGVDIFAPDSKPPLPFNIIERFAEEHAHIFAGGKCEKLSGLCDEQGFVLENYFAHEPLTLKNAVLTAETACAIMSQSTENSLLGSKALITGYGRIARALARRLRANGCEVTIAARRAEARTAAQLDGFSSISIEEIGGRLSDYDFIANTVPFELFAEEEFSRMKRESLFIELASLPEQPYRSLAEKYGVSYIFASGLPGKYSPKAAGKFIAEDVLRSIKDISGYRGGARRIN